MPIDFYGFRSRNKIIRPLYACGHEYAVKVSPDTCAAQVAIIHADCAELECPKCRAQAAREAARKERER